VIGDIILDRYIKGRVERISPEAPIPVVVEEDAFSRLGGAANVLQNIVAMGGQVFAFGVIGADEHGQEVCDLLQRSRIDVNGVLVDTRRRTTTKTRILAGGQQLLRIDQEDPVGLPEALKEQLETQLTQLFQQGRVDAVILEDYAKGILDQELAQGIVDAANQYGVLSLLDPNPRNTMCVKNLFLLKPNRGEAHVLSGVPPTGDVESSLQVVAAKLMADWQVQNLVITLAKDGMVLFSQAHSSEFIPTVAREVYDVSGAGDTVIATTALALATGADIRDAVMLGNLAAGIAVGKLGTSAVSQSEIFQELSRQQQEAENFVSSR